MNKTKGEYNYEISEKMLLGIASLVIASCGVPLWAAGTVIGVIMFFPFLIIGIFLCIDGYLTP